MLTPYGDFLRNGFANYSLENLDVILQKSIAFHKMKPSDPKFDDCLFELHDLMRAKGDVGVISSIISQVIRIRKDEHCHGHTSNETISLGDDSSQEDVRRGDLYIVDFTKRLNLELA